MKICANIINNFDKRSGLWLSNSDEQPATENTYGFVSHNPVLQNITDFLIEEASAEEEELLGENAACEPEDNTEKDLLLFKVISNYCVHSCLNVFMFININTYVFMYLIHEYMYLCNYDGCQC